MLKTISKILKVSSSVLIALAAILALFLVGMKVFGFQIYTILSPSMEPNYPTGAIIYVKEVDTATLKEGDVITFQLTDNMTATHRIIEVMSDDKNQGEMLYRTKGDNNKHADSNPVTSDRILGKVVFSIPVLGLLASYIQTRSGLFVCLAIAGALMLMVILSDMIDPDRKQSKNEENPS